MQSIDTALHFAAFHNRNLNGSKLARIFRFQSLHRAEIIRVFLIHTIDEDDKGFTKLQAIIHDGFRADGKNAVRADNEERPACRAQAFVAFAFEIIITGQIEKVDFNVFPSEVGNGSIDRHFLGFFKVVVIAYGRPVQNLTHTVNRAAVIKHSFHKRRFTFAAVAYDRNVTDTLKICAHNKNPPVCACILSIDWGVESAFGFSPFPNCIPFPQRTDNYNHYIILFHIFQGGF